MVLYIQSVCVRGDIYKHAVIKEAMKTYSGKAAGD